MSGLILFEQRLHELELLKTEVKWRTMIFQCESKESAAKFLGLQFFAFHKLSYEQWNALWRELDDIDNKAITAYNAGEFPDLTEKSLIWEISAAYAVKHPECVRAIRKKWRGHIRHAYLAEWVRLMRENCSE